jgi:hypothetical protein
MIAAMAGAKGRMVASAPSTGFAAAWVVMVDWAVTVWLATGIGIGPAAHATCATTVSVGEPVAELGTFTVTLKDAPDLAATGRTEGDTCGEGHEGSLKEAVRLADAERLP